MNLTLNTNANFDQIKLCITNIIKKTADDLELSLSSNYVKNLAVHLSMAIIRIQSNNYIPLSNGQMASYKQEYSYAYAKILCDRLASEFTIEFPEAEISLVSLYLSKNQKLDLEVNSGLDLLDENIFKILNETTSIIFNKYRKDFRKDDDLFIAIGLHLEPALDRLLNGQTVENPLKDDIIKGHPEEFDYSKILNDIVKQKYNLSFDDDELAYLTLHFATASEHVEF